MTKFSVAICGGGIAGLCLAAELVKKGNIRVNVYEASSKIEEVGANITLWGRVREALRLMDLEKDCRNASLASSSAGVSSATDFTLRGFQRPGEDFGKLPFRNALSLRRADLVRILLRRVPSKNIKLAKRLKKYVQEEAGGPLTLEFYDGTYGTCDILVGCDGIRSVTREQMMRQEADRTGRREYLRHVDARWTGNIVYRSLISRTHLAAKNSNHALLSGGQIYLGKNQHIIAHPASSSTLNVAVSITNPAAVNTRWPSTSWSTSITEETFKRKISPYFASWDKEAVEIIRSIKDSIEWVVMDVEPLPFYAKGQVVLIGDAAHAAAPYIGASAAMAIEDAYVLSSVLCAEGATRATLPVALKAYQEVRRPYGNRMVNNSRLALQEFQYNGPSGGDMYRIKDSIRQIFEEITAIGGSGPEVDANNAIFWMEVQQRRFGGR